MSEVRPHLLRRVLIRFLGGGLLLAAVFFGTAGTFRYWQAWLYLIVLLVPVTMAFVYLMRRDPEVLERRIRGREPRAGQRVIISAATFVLILAYVLPGLDQRFGWSDVPVPVVLVADLVSLLGYGLFVLVMRENRFASRTIAVDAGQQVVTSGPYRTVRHPMYVAVMVMYLAGPIALGSYWALLPALLLPILLAARILDEERLLVEELPGYRDYTTKTKFRLLPGLW